MGAMTRTFLAVELPEAIRRAIERLQAELRAEVPGLRWTAPEQLHLTLAFLGDVPTADLDRLCDAIDAAVAPLPRFAMEAAGLGAFPTPGRARVLWVGLTGEARSALDDLQRAVAGAARGAGHPPADDRFHPHVTLARSRAGRGPSPDLSGICGRYAGWDGGTVPVESVATIASELTPKGPIYRPLRSSPLGATSA